MKIVKAKKQIDDSYIERLQFNSLYLRDQEMKPGLLICYLFTENKNIDLTAIHLKASSPEVGIPWEWEYEYTTEKFRETYPALQDFMAKFDREDFGYWEMKFIYKGAQCTVSCSGVKEEIGFEYPVEADLNILPLVTEIEDSSYEIHRYDKELVRRMKEIFRLNQRRAVQSLDKLVAHKDIYNEFVKVIYGGKQAAADHPVSVEGFTAGALAERYPLSVLGAYNYLIYLRERPKEALADLEKGLKRK